MTTMQPKSTRSGNISLFMGLIALSFMGCASTSEVKNALAFPSDITQPYLVLDQVIDGSLDGQRGRLGRSLKFIFGSENKISLNQPTDMVVDAQGRLLIVEAEAGIISSYTETDGVWLNTDRVSVSNMKHPFGITVGPEHLFISDLTSALVIVLSYDFEVVGSIEHVDMQRPAGLHFDAKSNRLFVADPRANRVFVFSESGELVAQIGHTGSNRGLLQSPISVTVDPNTGNIFVLDGIARKIKQYDGEFRFISSFGEYDQVPGSFAFPKGIAVAMDGTLFVGDAAFGNIQMFDPSGALLFFFGETGTKPGQFLMPRNLFMDKNQRLFVADPYNNRVQVFQYFAQQ